MGEKLISTPSNNLGLSSAFLPGSLAAYNLSRAESDVILVARMRVEMVSSRWDPESSSCPRNNARELRPCRTMRGEKWRHQHQRQVVSNLVCGSVLDFDRNMVQDWKLSTDAIHGQSESPFAVVMALDCTLAAVRGRESLRRQCEGGAQGLLVADCSGVVQVLGSVLRDVPEGGFGEGFAMRPSGSNGPSPCPF